MGGNFQAETMARPDILNLVPYETVLYPGVVKLDANENPYPFPEPVQREIAAFGGGEVFSRYPDPMAGDLRAALAGYTGMPAANIMVGNGSDELILNLLLTFGTGGKAVVTVPTFSMYKIHSLIAGTEVVEVHRQPDFTLDLPALFSQTQAPGVKVLFICSPNNPTGNSVPLDEVEQILRHSGCLVVVDQAYLEFGGPDCTGLLNKYSNLVILRTFSKAFGLAGLRVGYLLAREAVIKQLLRVKQPFNLNAFSQLAARTVLQHLPLFQQQVQEIIGEREKLAAALAQLPEVEVFTSDTNYILFRTPLSGLTVYEGLLKAGILIRNMDQPLLPRCLRVTVGTAAENRLFLDKLALVLAGER